MAKKTKAQIQFEADTSGFSHGLKDANQSLITLRKELKLNGTELKGNADDVELLGKRHDILQSEAEQSEKKIQALQGQLETAERLFGSNSKEVYQLSNKLLDAKNEFQGIQNELAQTDKKLKSFTGEVEDSESALDSLKNTISAQEEELSSLKDEYANVALSQGKNSREAKALEKQIDSLNKELDDNKNKLDDVTGAAKETEEGFTIMKGAMADLVSNGIQSVISGVSDLIGSLFDLSGATEEYRVMQAKLEGSAETYGYSIDFVKSKYEDFYTYVGDDQMATNAITNLMGIGASTEDLSRIADGAIGVWATYGDSIPIESLTEAINETINVGKVTGTFADTINWAGITNEQFGNILSGNSEAQKAFNDAIKEGEAQEDAFSAALASTSDEAERSAIVSDFLNGIYGKSKTVYDEKTKSITEANRAELELKENQAELGEAIEPVNTLFKQFKNDALDAITPIVKDLATGFQDMVTWLKEHPTVMTVVTAVVTVLATAFTVLAVAMGIQSLIQGVASAFAFLNAILLANPIVLIVALIAGLVAGFIYLWNNCEEFRQFWEGLWQGVQEVFSVVVDWIDGAIQDVISFFQDLKTKAGEIFNNVKKAITDPIEDAKQKVTTTVETVKTNVTKTFDNLKNTVSDTFNNIKKAITKPIEDAKQKVGEVVDGIKGFFSDLDLKLPKIKLPHFKIEGKLSLSPPSVPKLKIDWYKTGAIFTKPTLFNTPFGFKGVGEAGAEGILPISQLEDWINNALTSNNVQTMMMNNTNIDRLVEIGESILSKDSNMYVDGRKVSEALSNSNDNVSGERISLKERGLVL